MSLLPAVHMEFLIAHESGGLIWGLTGAEDVPWFEAKAAQFTAYRGKPVRGRCGKCSAKAETEVEKMLATVLFSYVRLPPATRRAVGPSAPVAYWVGQCHSCQRVVWAADDGKPIEVSK